MNDSESAARALAARQRRLPAREGAGGAGRRRRASLDRRECGFGRLAERIWASDERLAGELGEPLVTVLGDRRYYGRHGFEPASGFGIEPPPSLPAEHFSVRPLAAYRPELRGRVVYPPAFGVP